jgi:hypothetical protein
MTLTEWNNVRVLNTAQSTIQYRGNPAKGRFLSDVTYPPWDSNMELQLLGRLRTVVAGSEFNLGVSLGTAHQSLQLIGDAAFRIAKSLRHVKRGNFAAAYHAVSGNEHLPGSKRVASNYLEYTYGLVPLLQDVHAGAEFLAHHLNTPQQIVVRVSHSRRYYELNPSKFASGYPDESWKYGIKSIKAIISEKNVAQLAGLTNPASVAWELLPWSFVVDWFIPIGDWLDARALVNGINGKFVTSYKIVNGGQEYSGRSAGRDSPGYRYQTVSMTRTVSTTLNVPFPKFKPLSRALSFKHCQNALALLRQVL